MKKNWIRIIALIVITVICVTALTACKSAEEKERDYYAEIDESMKVASDLIDTLTEQLNSANFSADFSIVMKEYNGVDRGDAQNAGWKRNYTNENGETVDYTWMVTVIDYSLVWENTDKIYISSKAYKSVDEDTYDKVKGKDNYDGKLEVTTEEKETKSLAEHLQSDSITALPLQAMFASIDRGKLAQDGLSMDKGNKIYTNILRVNMREIYDSNGSLVTRAINDTKTDKFDSLSEDAARGENVKYWSGYGEDIAYNWSKVYNMANTRVTMSYNGKKVLKSFELYSEDIISYYARKNTVDSTLVLKADVYRTTEMVMNLQTPKKGQTVKVPTE